jgi:hypothetical protein
MVAILFGIKISQERFGSLEISSCVPAVASGRAERVSLQRYIYLYTVGTDPTVYYCVKTNGDVSQTPPLIFLSFLCLFEVFS